MRLEGHVTGEAPEPRDAMTNVGDLVLVDLVEDLCTRLIVNSPKGILPVGREVQVGLLVGQAERGEEVSRGRQIRDRVPEEAPCAHLSEPHPPALRTLHVHLKVSLLIHEDLRQSATKPPRCIREAQECERHKLERLEFVMGEAVQCESSGPLILDACWCGCGRNGLVTTKFETDRSTRRSRYSDGHTGLFIGQAIDSTQLEREVCRVEDGLSKGTNLHGSPLCAPRIQGAACGPAYQPPFRRKTMPTSVKSPSSR